MRLLCPGLTLLQCRMVRLHERRCSFWGGGFLIGLKTENVRLLGARIHRQSVSLVCRNFQSCGERERWHKQDQAFHTEKN